MGVEFSLLGTSNRSIVVELLLGLREILSGSIGAIDRSSPLVLFMTLATSPHRSSSMMLCLLFSPRHFLSFSHVILRPWLKRHLRRHMYVL